MAYHRRVFHELNTVLTGRCAVIAQPPSPRAAARQSASCARTTHGRSVGSRLFLIGKTAVLLSLLSNAAGSSPFRLSAVYSNSAFVRQL